MKIDVTGKTAENNSIMKVGACVCIIVGNCTVDTASINIRTLGITR